MVSSKIVKREYPPRMYPAGKSPLQNKSMNHCCSLPDIGKRQRKDKKLSAITSFLGEDIYNDIRDNSQLGVLLKLASSVLGLNRGSRIPLELAKRVMDLEAFERYLWGRVGFEKLIKSVQVVDLAGDSYVVHGCVHVLLIWAYELVTVLGELFGRRIEGIEVPLLRWGCGRQHFVMEDVLKKDKEESEQEGTVFLFVRVKHFLMKPDSIEDIYLVWPDEAVKCDKKLHNMIEDIYDGCLDESQWEEDVAVVKSKKKKEVFEESADVVTKTSMKKSQTSKIQEEKKRKKRENKSEEKSDKVKKKQQKKTVPENEMDEESEKEREDVDMSIRLKDIPKKKKSEDSEVMKMLRLMNEKIDSKFDSFGRKVEDRFEAMENRINKVEETKGKEKPSVESKASADGGSGEGNHGDGSEDSTPSWMVNMKPTSDGESPIACVVRNPKSKAKVVRKVKVEPDDQKLNKQPVRGDKKKPDKETCIDVEELTEESGDSSIYIERTKFLSQTLDRLLEFTKDDDIIAGRPVRTLNLVSNQVSPYLGSSAVRRIMFGVHSSDAMYDPFETVHPDKKKKLIEYVKSDM
ncbi:unnamed protein product [Microthlaspi erraticum]|uniref:DUF1985 domain-containing protein n=1 Tax=Microthlaspi erraticum TaxID=1685480 RepID=A0A6D2HH92_9BRAS|nr:unnamed protein product [Microthlaspi erraticum]